MYQGIKMKMIRRMYRFLRYNEHKRLTLEAWILSAYFRFQMLYSDSKKLNQKWGIEGEESPEEATPEDYRYARRVAYAVNQVCEKTRWESKCLVRALTAQYLLKKRKIESTLYLGVGYDEENKMCAHAWIRCGQMYVTGGNGRNMTQVDCFRARI